MKRIIFIGLLLAHFSVDALELKRIKEDGSARHEQAFTLEGKTKVLFDKKSNFFDSTEDYRIGKLEADSKNVEALRKNAEEILAKIAIVDDFLKSSGKTFNDLSLEVRGHTSYYMLEGFIVKSGSELFVELEKLFSILSRLDYKIADGIELNDDFSEISFIKNDKVTKKEKFDIRFSCDKDKAPTTCRVKNYGLILIGK